jgi:hypothetical protein
MYIHVIYIYSDLQSKKNISLSHIQIVNPNQIPAIFPRTPYISSTATTTNNTTSLSLANLYNDKVQYIILIIYII